MNSLYRLMALDICTVFGSTSDVVVLVVPRMIPIGILAKEMSMLYDPGRKEGHTECRNVTGSE